MTDINIGALSEALNDKADRDFNNTAMTDYVIESGDYFVKYKSGKLIVWGYLSASTGNVVTFPKPFADVNYGLAVTGLVPNVGGSQYAIYCANEKKTTTGFTANWYGSSYNTLSYIAIGKGM